LSKQNPRNHLGESMSKKFDLKKQIKEMEDKARSEALALAAESAPSIVDINAAPETISFDQWWMGVSAKAGMKPYLKEILAVDFKARGLSKNETKEKFDATLKIFGINLP
jgi:hypothetical protein